MSQQEQKKVRRQRRVWHVRGKIRRTTNRPRLSVFRSSKHISAQIIDDNTGRTLCAATSVGKAIAPELSGKKKSEKAAVVGAAIAAKAKEIGVEEVVFDRGFARYHGRIKALADAARAGGLKF
ncbi:MAG: 50S ribosomal protein L18 [Planctomycetes bacterium]|nr:50S ribosomal protein L18 [Planctomycetota bacterium]